MQDNENLTNYKVGIPLLFQEVFTNKQLNGTELIDFSKKQFSRKENKSIRDFSKLKAKKKNVVANFTITVYKFE